MDTLIRVFQILLALLFTSGGLFKLILPYARFSNMPFQEWSKDFRPEHVRLIGILELSAAVAMFASLFVSSLATLTPFVAAGMALVMSGAIATHLRRSEYLNMVGNSVWLGLALFVAFRTLGGLTA